MAELLISQAQLIQSRRRALHTHFTEEETPHLLCSYPAQYNTTHGIIDVSVRPSVPVSRHSASILQARMHMVL